jgi:acetyltransferase-like isoleucine patch superfamily enzyme
VRGLTGLIKHRGLIGIHGSARVTVQGKFLFGRRVSIGRNSVIQIPRNSRLNLGNGVYIGREVEITPDSEIRIGDFTSVQDRCNILGQVDIGANCLFAPNVFMSSGTHQYMERPAWLIRDQDSLVRDPNHRSANPRSIPIRIHEDCWIGINAVVMRGVTVGRGSIIGANSVVTQSVDPYCVVAGTPARVISRRLEFAPPRTLSSADPEHLPYFYSGFDLRQVAISSCKKGLHARGRFELALDCGGASSIRIEIDSEQPMALTYSRQKRMLHAGPQVVTFELDKHIARRIDRTGGKRLAWARLHGGHTQRQYG